MDQRSSRGGATRQTIIEIATRLFAAFGYEATSTDLVLRESGVSRGALYHHFSSKQALFTAVLEATEETVAARVRQAATSASDPLAVLRAGCAAWLALAEDPVVKRIVLIDAPLAVGWQTWREIDDKHALGLIKLALAAAAAQGALPAGMVELYAHMLLATLIELALLIARADDPDSTAAFAAQAVDRMLAGLLGGQPKAV